MATYSQVRFVGLKTVFKLWISILYTLCCFGIVKGDYCVNLFHNRCVCTNSSVECHNANLTDIKRLYHYIHDHVVDVTIVGNNFTELPQNVLGSCRADSSLRLDDLKSLNLSRNNIQRIHGKTFHCMRKLEELDLSHNMWKNDLHEKQIGYFTSLPALKHLDLTNAFDDVWNGSIHMTKLSSIFNRTDMTNLRTLKLGMNEFFSFSEAAANSMCRLTKLNTLDLSHNNFESPSLPTISPCLENLHTLDLSHNKMKRLTNEFIDKLKRLPDLETVDLEGNLFNCDCGLLDTWYWLKETKLVKDKSRIRCADGFHSSYIDKPVLDIMPAELQCMELEAPSNVAVKVVTGVIFAVLGVTLVAFLIVNREKVKLLYKRWSNNMPKVNFRSRTGYKSVQEVAFVENV